MILEFELLILEIKQKNSIYVLNRILFCVVERITAVLYDFVVVNFDLQIYKIEANR